MPYRRVGTAVQVKRPAGWQTVKRHPTVAQAKRHVTALRINVKH